MPDTLEPIEVLWIVANLVGFAFAVRSARVAVEHRLRARELGRKHLDKAFRSDVLNARARSVAALCGLLVGVIAGATRLPCPGPRPLSGWVVAGLLFALPLHIVLRGASEERERRSIIHDIEVEIREGGRRVSDHQGE